MAFWILHQSQRTMLPQSRQIYLSIIQLGTRTCFSLQYAVLPVNISSASELPQVLQKWRALILISSEWLHGQKSINSTTDISRLKMEHLTLFEDPTVEALSDCKFPFWMAGLSEEEGNLDRLLERYSYTVRRGDTSKWTKCCLCFFCGGVACFRA